jgi:hypothetical protein
MQHIYTRQAKMLDLVSEYKTYGKRRWSQIKFNVIYLSCDFTKLIVLKEGNSTLATMPAHNSWVKAWLSDSVSPSDVMLDITVFSKSVGFCFIQVKSRECCPTFLAFIPKISDALSPVKMLILEDL